jgi:hypothetical protein
MTFKQMVAARSSEILRIASTTLRRIFLLAVARAFAGALAFAAVAADTLHSSLARAARRILREYGSGQEHRPTAAARTAPVNVFLSMVLLFV